MRTKHDEKSHVNLWEQLMILKVVGASQVVLESTSLTIRYDLRMNLVEATGHVTSWTLMRTSSDCRRTRDVVWTRRGSW